MSTYVKRSCPKCGHTIENWHKENDYAMSRFAYVFSDCPYCHAKIRIKRNYEFIMIDNVKSFFLECNWVFAVIFIVLLILELIALRPYSTNTLLAIGILILLFGIIFIIRILNFKWAITDSQKRTADPEYRMELYKHGLISRKAALGNELKIGRVYSLNGHKYVRMSSKPSMVCRLKR